MVKRHIKVPEGKDQKKVAIDVANILVDSISGNYGGAYARISELFRNESQSTLSDAELAYGFWREILVRTLFKTLRSLRVKTPLSAQEMVPILSNLFDRTFKESDANKYSMEHFGNPGSMAWVRSVSFELPNLVPKIDPEYFDRLKEQKRRGISFFAVKQNDRGNEGWARFARSVFQANAKAGLREVWNEQADRYNQITSSFSGPAAKASEQQSNWEIHNNWVKELVRSQPVFGQPEESEMTLAAMYVALRGYYKTPKWMRRESERWTLVDIHVELHDWLANDDVKDSIRVISGGPGSGKSSLAKVFASELVSLLEWNVLFIEMQHFNPRSDLYQGLLDYLSLRPRGPSLKHDPIQEDDGRPLIIIFDGLDELARSDEGQIELMRRFVDKVKRLVDGASGGSRKVRSLVLGRTVAAQEACEDADLAEHVLLHILPFTPSVDGDFGTGDGDEGGKEREGKLSEGLVFDIGNLAETDQRLQYWEKWKRFLPEHADEPANLTSSELKDLTGEPLILYLLLFSGSLQDDSLLDRAERNAIYEVIFSKIWERDRIIKNHPAGMNLSLDEFFTLMECQGLATWWEGGRTASRENFENIRDIYAPSRRRDFANLPAATLSNITLQFFSRKDEREKPGYEFIHKSFGEYLCARALVNLSKRFAKKLELGEEDEYFRIWSFICGNEIITQDILDFLFLEFKDISDIEISLLQEKLEKILKYLVSGEIGKKFDENRAAIDDFSFVNAVLCILGMLNGIARFYVFVKNERTHTFKVMDTGSMDAFRNFISLVSACRSGPKDMLPLMRNIELVAGTHMSEISLNNANFRRAKLVEVDFSDSNLAYLILVD